LNGKLYTTKESISELDPEVGSEENIKNEGKRKELGNFRKGVRDIWDTV
jgi:hypothetical protein